MTNANHGAGNDPVPTDFNADWAEFGVQSPSSIKMKKKELQEQVEEEARRILRDVLAPADVQVPLGQRLLNRFSGVAREDFTPPGRQAPRMPPAWDDGA